MKRVLLTEKIQPEMLEFLRQKTEVIISPEPKDEVVRKHVIGCNGLLVRSRTKLSRETIYAADSLEVIARTGTGVDNIDLEACTERGIPVCHTPEANRISVAEHVFALLLCLAKDIIKLDREIRQGNWGVRDHSEAFELHGKCFGVVGLGRTGSEVARLAKAFGMSVLAYDPYILNVPEELKVEMVENLQDLFQRADIISLHVPLTEETKGLVNRSLLESMKPTAILINTSRGGVIEEQALLQLLESGKLRGAGLDVFSQEPLPANHPLCRLPNVILSPHSAALTKECRLKMLQHAIEGLLDVLEGRKPQWVANREALRARGIDI